MKCVICFKVLIGKQKKFCSYKCRDRYKYVNHKEKYKENAEKWKINNIIKRKKISKKGFKKFLKLKRPRFNELMLNNYYKHRQEWCARDRIRKILSGKNGYKQRDLGIIKKCKICEIDVGLQIHHEEYPSKVKEIIDACNRGKIYYLCKKHHNVLREISKKTEVL